MAESAETPPQEFYANTARWTGGVYDFMIEFGLQDAPLDPVKASPIKPLVRVRMSPQHAYVLSKALDDVLNKYRDQVGEIKVPDAVFKQMGIEP